MFQTLALARRNLWRNGGRTAITLGAITFSTGMLIFMQALIDGMVAGTVRNATNLSVGEAEIHAPGYLEERSFYDAIPEPGHILREAQARGVPGTARSFGYGLVAHGTKSAGALFWGVDPGREREVFDLARHVDRGSFLGDDAAGGVVLGKKLARTLGVGVGDELVVVVQAADGSLGNELYTVTGVLKSIGESIDRSAAFLHRNDFAELFVSGGRIHELAFNTRGALPLDRIESVLHTVAPSDDVRTWRQLLPALSDMVEMSGTSMWIFGSIFFIAAGLGVLNTMLMATYERIHEFGVLKALGTSPWRIAGDVAAEAWVLGLFGSAAGLVLGVAVSQWVKVHGIDTASFAGETSFGGVAFDPVWRALLTPRAIVIPVLAMWLTSVVAALYPATIAARLRPVEALNHP
jgi:ABC-type lipoprotein release transport system permease subunit